MDEFREEFRRLQEEMERMLENMWGTRKPFLLPSPPFLLPPPAGELPLVRGRRNPYLDLIETDKELTVRAEMPGLNKEDININIAEDKLEISAETKHEEEKKEKGYIYKERRSGGYYRSITLPTKIDTENAKASYENGILEIKMPKTEIKAKTSLKVE